MTAAPVSVQTLPMVRWGDSLTANWTVSSGPLHSSLGRAALNDQGFGIGSQKSTQIAVRQRGKPARLAAALTLPVGTALTELTLDVDLLQGTGVATGATRSLNVSIMGIKGNAHRDEPRHDPVDVHVRSRSIRQRNDNPVRHTSRDRCCLA